MADPKWLNLELVDSTGAPMAGRDYELSFDGDLGSSTGTLDADGRVSARVPEGARRAALVVATRRLELVLTGMPAAGTVAGAQERLNQLNFFTGPVDGQLGPATAAALRGFQAQHGLDTTGTLDDATVRALTDEHGS